MASALSSPRAQRLDRESWRRCSAQVSQAFKGLATACEHMAVAFTQLFSSMAAAFMSVRLPAFGWSAGPSLIPPGDILPR